MLPDLCCLVSGPNRRNLFSLPETVPRSQCCQCHHGCLDPLHSDTLDMEAQAICPQENPRLIGHGRGPRVSLVLTGVLRVRCQSYED